MSIVFVIAILARLSARSVHCREHLRVYQGEDDSHGEFPVAVILQEANTPRHRFCTGSLIADQWVLTAAYCVVDKDPEEMVIRYGDFTKLANETNLYSKVIKIFCHPNYIEIAYINNIVMIFVEKVPIMKHVKILALDYKTYVGLQVKYAGFGNTHKNNVIENLPGVKERFQSIPLLVGEGIVVQCEKYTVMKHKILYKHSYLCVAPKCSKKKQQGRVGDSGGPLLYDGRLIGVSSALYNTVPISVFNPVSPYIEWIQNIIHSNQTK